MEPSIWGLQPDNGVTSLSVIGIAGATLIIDLLYPLLIHE